MSYYEAYPYRSAVGSYYLSPLAPAPPTYMGVPGLFGGIGERIGNRIKEALVDVKQQVEGWAMENEASEYTITLGVEGLGLSGSVTVTFKGTHTET